MVADLARLIQRGMALWGFDYAAVAKHWGNLVLPEHSSLPPNKGMLKGEPVIAVTGSGQKIQPPLASLPLNALMAQTALGSEISLLKHGLSSSPHLLFFPPSRSQRRSLLHKLLTQTN